MVSAEVLIDNTAPGPNRFAVYPHDARAQRGGYPVAKA